MDDLEVIFCDLCNTSVPEQAIETGAAMRIRGRVIGPCCLGQLQASTGAGAAGKGGAAAAGSKGVAGAAAHGAATGRTGLLAAAVVILAAIAAGVLFVDWRLSEENADLADKLSGLEERIDAQADRLGRFDSRLENLARTEDVSALDVRLQGIVQASESASGESNAQRREIAQEVASMAGELRALAGRQNDATRSLERIRDELGLVSGEIQRIAAMPRGVDPSAAGAAAVRRGTEAGPMDGAAGSGEAGLPAELAHLVTMLADSDEGTRFEAVDELLQSGDQRVVEHVLPLAKDPDLFVRRLVVEGLATFKQPRIVDALIVSLADPESLVRNAAYRSLKSLTGQDIEFDPDASAEQRSSAQRRWRQWWEKNRASF